MILSLVLSALPHARPNIPTRRPGGQPVAATGRALLPVTPESGHQIMFIRSADGRQIVIRDRLIDRTYLTSKRRRSLFEERSRAPPRGDAGHSYDDNHISFGAFE
jgi:hypothetical protein